MNAGDQNPLMPLVETAGKDDPVAPEHIVMGLNVGVIIGFTVMVKVVLTAHWPASGVKLYNVVAVLFSEGDHDPVTPFKEVVGKGVNASPEQIGVTGLKVGVTLALTFTVTLSEITVPHVFVAVSLKTILPAAAEGSV